MKLAGTKSPRVCSASRFFMRRKPANASSTNQVRTTVAGSGTVCWEPVVKVTTGEPPPAL